ncbi:hypothetical protein [Citrobacter sp. Cb004]|uniref:hypothetical protein n=1 Tax=Citrobacter sp. Cb004 TaxID=2985006 RepID=UPI002574A851|nr:hypothetical protein [Citrobacter sp. Cb004]MDM3354929.1 hypothetical protein [Citrobacter sp. Cb004]
MSFTLGIPVLLLGNKKTKTGRLVRLLHLSLLFVTKNLGHFANHQMVAINYSNIEVLDLDRLQQVASREIV